MISRRGLIGTGIGTAALGACPALAQHHARALLVVDPAVLHDGPPATAIVATGPALLDALLSRIGRRGRIDAFAGHADVSLLAELVRFQPRLGWTIRPLEHGSRTMAGRLSRPAQWVTATWG